MSSRETEGEIDMILVTGATGNVGSEVVARLLASETKVRVLTRDAAKAARFGDQVEVARGDLGDAESVARAVIGVDAIFLMSGSPSPGAFGPIVAAAKAQGDLRIVLLSTCWAAPSMLVPDPITVGAWHAEMEDTARASGLRTTILRPSAFMTNALGWAGSIRAEGLVHNPFGDGRTAPIAPEDIAAVAAQALTDPARAGETLELTGPQLLTAREQVDVLARVLGVPIRCVDVPVEAAVHGMVSAGMPMQIAEAVGQSFEAVRAGRATTMTETFERTTGQLPMTFEAWARKHAARFDR